MLNNLIDIGDIIQNAALFSPRNWRDAAMASDALLQAIHRLFDLLETRGASYVLVGGVALLNYVEGRNTQDIDLIMAVDDLENITEIQVTYRDQFFARGDFQGLQIDIFLTTNPLFRKVQQEHVTTLHFQEHDVRIATVRGLLLLKLYALPSLYRQGDFLRVNIYENDIAALMYQHHPDMDAILSELAPYISATDLASLQKIVHEIDQRIKRFRTNQPADN